VKELQFGQRKWRVIEKNREKFLHRRSREQDRTGKDKKQLTICSQVVDCEENRSFLLLAHFPLETKQSLSGTEKTHSSLA